MTSKSRVMHNYPNYEVCFTSGHDFHCRSARYLEPFNTGLSSLQVGSKSKTIPVKMEVSSETSLKHAVEVLTEHCLLHLNIVTPIHELCNQWEINTIGTFLLFRAVWHLLEVATSPKLVTLLQY